MATRKVQKEEGKALAVIDTRALSNEAQSWSRQVIGHITSPADLALANEQRKQVGAFIKRVKEQEERLLKPQREAIAATRDLFAPVKERAEAAMKTVKGALAEYERGVQEKLEAKREILEEKVEKGEITEGQAKARTVALAERLGAPSIPTSTRRDIEIVDIDRVPLKYRPVDMVAVRRDALAGIRIPGVKVVEKTIIVNR